MKHIPNFDIVYWILRWTILIPTFRTLKNEIKSGKVEGAEITMEEVKKNTHKHSMVIYSTIALLIYVIPELKELQREEISILLTVILPIAAVMGMAWYYISFGAIPESHLLNAYLITFAMFFPFIFSMTLMGTLLLILLPIRIAIAVITIELFHNSF